MVGPAIRQLLHDLEHVSDRSEYEEALLGEIKPLVALAERFEPVEQAIQISLSAAGGQNQSSVSLRRTLVSRLSSAFTHDSQAIPAKRAGLEALGSLTAARKCSKSDCPLKNY